MANLSIEECSALLEDNAGNHVPILPAPPLAVQNVTFSTATQSAAFNTQTRIVRFISDADCYILFGSNPTATAANAGYHAADVEYFRRVHPGDKLSVYDGVS